jgi:hypothetical protein
MALGNNDVRKIKVTSVDDEVTTAPETVEQVKVQTTAPQAGGYTSKTKYFLPKYGVTVEADSLDEAVALAEKSKS